MSSLFDDVVWSLITAFCVPTGKCSVSVHSKHFWLPSGKSFVSVHSTHFWLPSGKCSVSVHSTNFWLPSGECSFSVHSTHFWCTLWKVFVSVHSTHFDSQWCDISSSNRFLVQVLLLALLCCDFTVAKAVPVPVETCNSNSSLWMCLIRSFHLQSVLEVYWNSK